MVCWLHHSAGQSILGQDTEPRLTSAVFIGLWMLDSKHFDIEKSACMNVYVNWRIKYVECSSRVEKNYARTSPFSFGWTRTNNECFGRLRSRRSYPTSVSDLANALLDKWAHSKILWKAWWDAIRATVSVMGRKVLSIQCIYTLIYDEGYMVDDQRIMYKKITFYFAHIFTACLDIWKVKNSLR